MADRRRGKCARGVGRETKVAMEVEVEVAAMAMVVEVE
jgi:hypothetical protein